MSGFSIKATIPNYNGRSLLAANLPSVLGTLKPEQVIVVDDASSDESVEMLRRNFPGVAVVSRSLNGGFSAAANDGLRSTDSSLVLLLNSDVQVTPAFLDAIVPMFEDASVFAVTPRIITPALGDIDDGAKTGRWRRGFLWTDALRQASGVRPNLFASGCASVYRVSMLQELGGFDEAYAPFYWEDVDLSYRAWKRGWQSLYQPAGLVYHQHSATISRADPSRTNAIKARNCLLFLWRNIEDLDLVAQHRRWLGLVLAGRAAAGDWPFVRGWRMARGMRMQAIAARNADSRHRRLTDREILSAAGVTGVPVIRS